jgi:asparagine synthase (glutamine-hydrolysing)
MCGIAGVVNLNGEAVPVNLVRKLTDAQAHRGPDGEGHYTDGHVGLGHRRLAIIDLSAAGHQPMANENGDVIITFNGEIYNFHQLRVELEALGHQFHSRTDTESIIHAYEEWGEECVHRFNGMFAFAIWDRPRRRLFLARDRYGIKPLYWYCGKNVFVFASEVKAILEHPHVSCDVCLPALNEYFTFQNIFTDLTLFEGIRLLPAGSTLLLDVDKQTGPQQRRYWDYPLCPEPLAFSEEECVERLYQCFVQGVTRQLVSDVPVGSYLSGGMDSGSIATIAARHVDRLTTFTGGFDLTSASGLELAFDERQSAERMANLLKSEHYEVVLHAGDMEWVLPRLIWHLEDLRVGQCYPNYYVARLASKFVKVVLCGTGGDELFGGYPWRYVHGLSGANAEDYYRRYYAFWQRLVPDTDKDRLFSPSTRRDLGDHSAFDVFRDVFRGVSETCKTNEDYINACLYFELKTFLHGLLVVEDKLSMAHSLETRVPFLDDDLVDFALRVPVRYKLRNLAGAIRSDENLPGTNKFQVSQTNDGKMILRKAMGRLIPTEISDRNKQGFSAPDASWFRGESIDYINRLLRNPRASLYELVEPAYVADVLDQHCSGKVNRRLLIWSFLCLEWWLRQFFASGRRGESLPDILPLRKAS